MEAVKLFNSELSSLYETKPPISKAKMTLITRTAMKAIKFYKHVVQSVEKFIQKCKPEYKVPGLYVIDSIVRQSRHQYTAEKDVFAPRFARNIKTTFLHLFNCTPEDKSKIVRVLNLWQKNNVFTADVIQPLLDLAASVASRDSVSSNGVETKTPPINSTKPRTPNAKNSPAKDPSWLTAASRNAAENNKMSSTQTPKVKMDKKMFDYDYGEDDDMMDDGGVSPVVGGGGGGRSGGTVSSHSVPPHQHQTPLPNLESLSSILSNPEVLRQLHTLQQQMAARQQQQEMEEKMRKLQEMRHQEEEFDRHLAQTVPNLPFASECDFKPGSGGAAGQMIGGAPGGGMGAVGNLASVMGPPSVIPPLDLPLMVQPPPVPPPSANFTQPSPFSSIMDKQQTTVDHSTDYDERARQMQDLRQKDMDTQDDDSNSVEVIDLVRSPSRETSEPRRRRSTTRSRGRRSRSRSRRRRSRSNERDDREWDGRKQRDMDREKDRERRKKGLPPIRKNHLTVCSTTLWVGHLSKLIHEDQLSNIFGEYGEIVSINLIPPRGCAFICMNRRQDAQRALHGLKYYKIQSKLISVAWAPGKGMKDKEWKDYWEVDVGASYIPWNKLSSKTNFALLEEGGMLDQDTFPDWLHEKYFNMKREEQHSSHESGGGGGGMNEGLAPPLPPPGGPQPPPTMDMHGPPPPQPPPPTPLPPAMSLLPPPPFPIQPSGVTGLLGPMGMAMGGPPGMVGNMPLGVPPPLMVPQQMMPRLPPQFNNQFGLVGGPLEKRDSLLGVPPPPIPAQQPLPNPFGLPDHALQVGVNNTSSTNSLNIINSGDKGGGEGAMEMDVVNETEEEADEREDSPKSNKSDLCGGGQQQQQSVGGQGVGGVSNNGRGLLGDAPDEDTDMRLGSEGKRIRGDQDHDSFRSRWPDRVNRSPHDGGRIEERPPLIPNAPPMMMPPFDHHFQNRPGRGGRDEEESMYQAGLLDYPPPRNPDYPTRGGPDFPPRGGNPDMFRGDFPPPRGGMFFSPRGRPIPPRMMRSPNGPMFGPRGGPPVNNNGPNMGMRGLRHQVRVGGPDGRDFMMRGGWGPRGNGRFVGPQGGVPPFGPQPPVPPQQMTAPPQQPVAPPQQPLLQTPTPTPRRRNDGERKSRWSSAPADIPPEDMFSMSPPKEIAPPVEEVREANTCPTIVEPAKECAEDHSEAKEPPMERVPSLYSPETSTCEQENITELPTHETFHPVNPVPSEIFFDPVPQQQTSPIPIQQTSPVPQQQTSPIPQQQTSPAPQQQTSPVPQQSFPVPPVDIFHTDPSPPEYSEVPQFEDSGPVSFPSPSKSSVCDPFIPPPESSSPEPPVPGVFEEFQSADTNPSDPFVLESSPSRVSPPPADTT